MLSPLFSTTYSYPPFDRIAEKRYNKSMKNQKTFAATAGLLNFAFASPRYSEAVYDRKGDLVGANVGTSVRPQIVPIDPLTTTESVAQFLARGGVVKIGRSKQAIGFARASMRTKPFHNVATSCSPSFVD